MTLSSGGGDGNGLNISRGVRVCSYRDGGGDENSGYISESCSSSNDGWVVRNCRTANALEVDLGLVDLGGCFTVGRETRKDIGDENSLPTEAVGSGIGAAPGLE